MLRSRESRDLLEPFYRFLSSDKLWNLWMRPRIIWRWWGEYQYHFELFTKSVCTELSCNGHFSERSWSGPYLEWIPNLPKGLHFFSSTKIDGGLIVWLYSFEQWWFLLFSTSINVYGLYLSEHFLWIYAFYKRAWVSPSLPKVRHICYVTHIHIVHQCRSWFLLRRSYVAHI